MKAPVASVALVATLALGCTVGDPERVTPNPTDDPGSDDPLDDGELDNLGIICETTLSLSGTFAESQPKPDDVGGCWPTGTWTVDVAIDFAGCDPQPDFADVFRYEVVDGAVTWLDDPSEERVNLGVAGDGGNCRGLFEHFGSSGDERVVIALQPTLEADDTLAGRGTWTLHGDDPF